MSENKGTYVGLRVLPESAADLTKFVVNAGIPIEQSKFERRLHTTLIYSRKWADNVEVDPARVFDVTFRSYTFFTGQKGENVLVMLLESKELERRHTELMKKYNFSYDYPVFNPHITLHYNYPDRSVLGIPYYDKPIKLGLEYTEDLDLEWGR